VGFEEDDFSEPLCFGTLVDCTFEKYVFEEERQLTNSEGPYPKLLD
tara:strand:- start:148 stop:285 length:138 start_codon:yes stop_codon:yes gene_type:complete